MSDEGRMLSPEEARLRKAVRKSRIGDDIKVKFNLKKNYSGRNTRTYLGTLEIGTKRNPAQSKVAAALSYAPKEKTLEIGDLYPIEYRGKRVPLAPYEDQADEYAHKIFSKRAVREAVAKTSKMFPAANELYGLRATGAHFNAKKFKPQRFDLAAIRKRLARSGKYGKAAALGLSVAEKAIK